MSHAAIDDEQHYLNGMYARLDEIRAESQERRTRAFREHGTSRQDLVERDARVAREERRRVELDRAEHQLCFGRIDRRAGQIIHIGRMGLRDADLKPLLVDWRAPVAADFYTATALSGSEVVRRRHIRTEGREVVGVDDELLDLDAAEDAEDLSGDAALMQSLASHRTGRMGEIVATLQAEQDAIIRAPARGALIVQGGPGTGKTVVALHRAAYLLYTYPRIAERGVLVVGPNGTFLSYISQVLPSLGENDVVLATPDTVLPGIRPGDDHDADPGPPDAEAVALVKGRLVMAEVIAAAVRDRQGSEHDATVLHDGDEITIPAEVIDQARTRARRAGEPHNLARRQFREEIYTFLSSTVAENTQRLLEEVEEGFEEEVGALDRALGKNRDAVPAQIDASGTEVTGTVGDHELRRLREELLADPGIASVVDALWPALTATQLLEDLLGDADRLDSAVQGADLPDADGRSADDLAEATSPATISAADRKLLRRDPGSGWTTADIPLLDEAAELLGEDDSAEAAQARARRAQAVREAERALGTTGVEQVSATDLADVVAEQDGRPLAERAAADRTWAYGHLVVDEAQELSPMQWRMLLRRVPSGSVTVVGDAHQTSSADGTSWSALREMWGDRPSRIVELTVNYRTPQVVMDAAAPVLALMDPTASAPQSARPGGDSPRWVDAYGDLAACTAELASSELTALEGGHLAVICPEPHVAAVADAVARQIPDASSGPAPELESRCVVITPEQSKGLEFDGVIIADASGILASPRGPSALYIALTRATTRLTIVNDGPLPDVLTGLPRRGD